MSNWTPASLTSSGKPPLIWLDCASSNFHTKTDEFVSFMSDKFGSSFGTGNDMNSLPMSSNSILRQFPTTSISNQINGLNTVTFTLDTTSAATGFTQPKTIDFSGTGIAGNPNVGKIVLVARQGIYPGSLFGINSNNRSPWEFVSNGYSGTGGTATGKFANIPSVSSLYSTIKYTDALSNLTVPESNTIFMLSMSNLHYSQNFNGVFFNCETWFPDGATPSNRQGWTGDFCEMVVWKQDSSIIQDTQALVEGYLAHKWGIASLLNYDHPFKSTAPDFTANPAPFGSYANLTTPLLWLDASDPVNSSSNFVTCLRDKSSYKLDMNTRPESKTNIVWPIKGAQINGLSTTRFTQYAALTQPTSVEKVTAVFLIGRQGAIPSSGTWIQNLLGHDRYSDFSATTTNQFMSNAAFPSYQLYIDIGYVTNAYPYPPQDSTFIFVQTIPQSQASPLNARFQGLCYDSKNANSGWTGDLGELIVFKNTALTSQQIDLMIMYLANKWGLVLDDYATIFPNVKPPSTFSPSDFNPAAWYDSSDSQVNVPLKRFDSIDNMNYLLYKMGAGYVAGKPSFANMTSSVDGKFGNFSGLRGNPCIERPLNGLPTIYMDDQSTLLFDNNATFASTDDGILSPLTNIFFVGRTGQYANSIQLWNPLQAYNGSTGYYVTYNNVIYENVAYFGSNNIGYQPDTHPLWWTPTTNVQKYQTIFGNEGYNCNHANPTNFAGNPLLGGAIIPSQELGIDGITSLSNMYSNASISKNSVNSTVFNSNYSYLYYNDGVLSSATACYSINQLGNASYQITTSPTQFTPAQLMTGKTVTFPSPASTFLLSVNGLQSNGTQNTKFKGFFYDDMAFNDGWQGDFAEVITFTNALTPQQVLLVEGYLAVKWGLQSALPPNHPFFYSGTTQSNCLTGYSPLTMGEIGAIVNSSNDSFMINGLGYKMTIPQNTYTEASFLLMLNSLLPYGLTVQYSSNSHLFWKNTTSELFTIVANTSNAASVLGINNYPSFFAIAPEVDQTVTTPFALYCDSRQVYTWGEPSDFQIIVGNTENGDTHIFKAYMDSHQVPSGDYSVGISSLLASAIQDEIQFRTGIPIQIFSDDSGVLIWNIDPVFFSASRILTVGLYSSNASVRSALGISDSNNIFYLPRPTFANSPSAGDPSYPQLYPLGIFDVTGANDTLYINDVYTYINLNVNVYTSETLLTEIDNQFVSNGGKNIQAHFMYQPYSSWFGLSQGYYLNYSYMTNVENSVYLFTTSPAPYSLFGIETTSSYGIKSITSPSYTTQKWLTPEVGATLTIQAGSGSKVVPLISAQCESSTFSTLLQEGIRSAFLYLGTPTNFTVNDASDNIYFLQNMNGYLSADPVASNYLNVTNVQGYMLWSNSSLEAFSLIPEDNAASIALGLEGSTQFTIYPSSLLDLLKPATLVAPGGITTSNTQFVTLSPTTDLSITRIFDGYNLTWKMTPGQFTVYDLFSNNIQSNNHWNIDSNNYIWWSNTTPSTYAQTIHVSDSICAINTGLFMDETQSFAEIILNTNVVVGDSRPFSPGCGVSVNAGNYMFDLSNNSYSGHLLNPTIACNNYYNVSSFAVALNVALAGTGLLAYLDGPNDPITGLQSTLLFSNTLAQDTQISANIYTAALLGIAPMPDALELDPCTTTTFPFPVYGGVDSRSIGDNARLIITDVDGSYTLTFPYGTYLDSEIASTFNDAIVNSYINTSYGFPTTNHSFLSNFLTASFDSGYISLSNNGSGIMYIQAANRIDAFSLGLCDTYSEPITALIPAGSSVLALFPIMQYFYYNDILVTPCNDTLQVSGPGLGPDPLTVTLPDDFNTIYSISNAFQAAIGGISPALQINLLNSNAGDSNILNDDSRFQFINLSSNDITITCGDRASALLGITSPFVITSCWTRSPNPVPVTTLPVVNPPFTGSILVNGYAMTFDDMTTSLTLSKFADYLNGYAASLLSVYAIEYTSYPSPLYPYTHITYSVKCTVGFGYDLTPEAAGFLFWGIDDLVCDGTTITLSLSDASGFDVGQTVEIIYSGVPSLDGQNFVIYSKTSTTIVLWSSIIASYGGVGVLLRHGPVVTVKYAKEDVFNGNFEIVSVQETSITLAILQALDPGLSSSSAEIYILAGNDYGFAGYPNEEINNLYVTIGPGNFLQWNNRGPTALTITLDSTAALKLGYPSAVEFLVERHPRFVNASTAIFNHAAVNFSIYGLALPQPLPIASLVLNNDQTLTFTNNSAFELLLTPSADGGVTSTLLGFSSSGSYASLVLPASGIMSPYLWDINPLLSGPQSITIYGTSLTNGKVTLIDGTYNSSSFAGMVEAAISKTTGLTVILVRYGNTFRKLSYTNILPVNLTLSATLKAAILLGYVNPSETSPGIYTFTIPANSTIDALFEMIDITTVNICIWDGAEGCPASFTEVDSDNNEKALPFATKCAKPFSQLLPQVITNAGQVTQSYSCPIGTELIAQNQYADPEHPVCSFICDPPYYDSGLTCGYLPVYNPLDNKTLNILNDYNAPSASFDQKPSNGTTSAIKFLILAVIFSFLLGLAIKLLPTLTKSPPKESAAGAVLQKMISKK